MSKIDWNELVQSKKEVRASDRYSCGNVMAEYDDNIIVIIGPTKYFELTNIIFIGCI
jgi:hypothetical protein